MFGWEADPENRNLARNQGAGFSQDPRRRKATRKDCAETQEYLPHQEEVVIDEEEEEEDFTFVPSAVTPTLQKLEAAKLLVRRVKWSEGAALF